jgi:hypothetical protein
MDRRDFLKHTGLAAGWGLCSDAILAAGQAVTIAVKPGVATPAVEWALGELRKRVTLRDDSGFRLRFGRVPSGHSESFAILPSSNGLDISAAGERGFVYAILELAQRADQAHFGITSRLSESPANAVRSVARFFVSDAEDKSWYNDRGFWAEYLTMLAANRFNRFNLTLGIGYDFARQIRDCYFHFPYPFLLDVKGYQVRAKGLPDDERDGNFAMLKFIAKETVARGLQFHLALWTHAYQWTDSPAANYTIEGLSPKNHAAYCHDALSRILAEVPEISGLTFRIHGESGVAEGSYDFWQTLFHAAKESGRTIALDLHAKGIDSRMIETALATGLPVTVSPKFMAEHMGLPYQQAGIRELEMPPRESKQGFFALSDGERRFMRYSFGDLFDEKRKYRVMFRVWPGTQRLLLWGDPEFAAAYGKAFQFCGASGVEWCEPLSFKGRKGGGLPGGRTGYADASLTPTYDFQKYEYTFKLWGRAMYNPATVPQAATPAEKALASASRILPLITSAHGPSAANNNYWPEMYYNMSVVDPAVRNPYGDSPQPRVFGTVSPFDPEIFASVMEEVQAKSGVKYTPSEVARWLDELADVAMQGDAPRAWAVDIRIQAGLGRFFAAKFRSAVAYETYQRDRSRHRLEQAVQEYRAARNAWAGLAETAKGVYRSDVSFGYEYQLRGHWLDRLPAIDEDIARMQKMLDNLPPSDGSLERIGGKRRAVWECRHEEPPAFRRGKPIDVALSVKEKQVDAVVLHYRRVNQVERFLTTDMTAKGSEFRGRIPGEYTDSPFPVQYYFELRWAGTFAMYPGIGPLLSSQPYFVVRQV